MLGKIEVIEDGKQAVFIRFQEPVNFKEGQEVTVNPAKKNRTLKQNALLWVFYDWLIHPRGGDLRSQGHYSSDALHENVKGWFHENHPNEFKIDGRFTTTELTKEEFGKFLDIANLEFFIEHLGVDTSGFWRDYERLTRWQTTNPGGMREYLKERMPF